MSEHDEPNIGTWSREEIRRVGHRVIDLMADYLTGLPDGPVFRPVPEEAIARFEAEPVPEAGQEIDALLDEFDARVAAYPFGNGHPRFFGWVNSAPAVVGIFGDLLAAMLNPSVAGGNHAPVHVEHQVVRWFKEILDFPEPAMGLLTSGGSMASLTGLTVARHVKLPDVRTAGMQRRDRLATAYTSEEGHTCIKKAFELLGFGRDNVRLIPMDDRLRIDVDRLDEAIRRDREAGHVPVVVAASGGTASTGTIDPLREIRDVCDRHDAWMHVDAAYGGPAILSGRARDALAPLADADSLAIDPHKWMYVPVEAGLALVRDGAAMRDAFSLVPPYIRTEGNASGVMGPPWFSEYGFQQTRGFRALKVWMALKHHGRDGYARAIDRDIALAECLADRIRAADDLELLIEPGLSIVCFRHVPPHLRDAGAPSIDAGPTPDRIHALNAWNARLLEAVQLRGEAFLTSTLVRGAFALRACLVNPRTTKADVDFLADHIRDVAGTMDRK